MGLQTWKNAPKGKIMKTDVTIAKTILLKRNQRTGKGGYYVLGLRREPAARQIPMKMLIGTET
jgi:hypothetical protein